jgi:hypothetical protein
MVRQDDHNLFIDAPYSTVQEIKAPGIECRNEVRTYCSQWSPDPAQCGFIVQLRYTGGIGELRSGKPRKMLASMHLSLAELRAILAYAEASAAR